MRLHWAIVLLACACSVRPKEVPSEPGTFTDLDDVAPVWFLANPANQFLLFHFVAFRVESVALAACPVSSDAAVHQVDVVGEGCVDGDGVVWFGKDEKVEEGAKTTHTLRWFGTDVTALHHRNGSEHLEYWTLNGSATVEEDDDTWIWRTAIGFERRFDDVTRLGYVHTEATYVLDDRFHVTELTGKVGVEDWGLAEIDGHNLPASYTGPCDEPGELTIEGTNALTVDFSTCGAPTFSLDGGAAEALPVTTPEAQLGVPTPSED